MKNIKDSLLVYVGFFCVIFVAGTIISYNVTRPSLTKAHLVTKTSLIPYPDQYVLRYDCNIEGVPYTYKIDSKKITRGFTTPMGTLENAPKEALGIVSKETAYQFFIGSTAEASLVWTFKDVVEYVKVAKPRGRHIVIPAIAILGGGSGYFLGTGLGKWLAEPRSVSCDDPKIDAILKDPKYWQEATQLKWNEKVKQIKEKLYSTAGSQVEDIRLQKLKEITEGPNAPSSDDLKSEHFKTLFDLQKASGL